MPKLDKSLYTKEEAAKLMEQRRKDKALKEIQKTNVNPSGFHSMSKVNPENITAFVLGNGTSRQSIDPNILKQYGKVYGCNAIYREFDPDYLVAVDVKMVNEICKAGYQHKNPNVWTNPNKAFRQYEGLNLFQPSKGWSSGPTALWLSTQHAYQRVFILGFDYKGLDNGKRVNNIYAGTENYKKTTDSATYYGNWLKQTTTTVKTHARIQFYRVIQPDNYVPPELNKFNNLKHIYIEDFKKMFNIS